MNHILHSIWLGMFFLSFTLHANYSSDFLHPEQLLELIQSHDESILSTDQNGEVYFNPNLLSITEQGLCVKTANFGLLKIPVLFSNIKGSYTLLSEGTVYPVIRCWNCKKPFSPSIFNKGKCPSCGEQN